MNGIGIIIIFLVLVLIKTPIAFSIGLPCLLFFITNNIPIQTMTQMMLSVFENFALLAIPLFMLAGQLMNMGGVTDRIFAFCKALVGHIPGGLGHVNILASLVFAGMSGSATADSAGLGTIEINYMKKEGYDPAFAAAITAASSTVGPIMPPSLGFVIYGAMTGVSIGALFIAGVVPAIMMTLFQMVTVYLEAKKRKFKVYPRSTLKAIVKSFFYSLLPMLTPLIIILGIITGVATPTEIAVVAVLYSIFLGILVYKELTIKNFIDTIINVAKGTSRIMLIVAFALVLGWILTYEGIPRTIASMLLNISSNKYIILIIISLFILFLGMFMEGISIMLIVVPVLLPILRTLDINLVHFGVLLVLNLNIGLITPPLGVCAYICADIAEVPFHKVTREVLPFLVSLLIVLFLILILPQTTLWLPSLFGLMTG